MILLLLFVFVGWCRWCRKTFRQNTSTYRVVAGVRDADSIHTRQRDKKTLLRDADSIPDNDTKKGVVAAAAAAAAVPLHQFTQAAVYIYQVCLQ